MEIENRWILACDILIISFTVARLSLEYIFHPLADWLFVGFGQYQVRVFHYWSVPYSLFPDILKEKIFLFMVDWPYFLVRFVPWLTRRKQ